MSAGVGERVGQSVDTIVALATPGAPAARAVLRMSGPRAIEIAERLMAPSPGTPGEGGGEGTPERELFPAPRATPARKFPLPIPPPEYRERGLSLGHSIVPVKALVFHAPRSSTGEDVVEFHLPGSPWIVGQTLDRLFALGARQAEPGEFTSRAFLNGKLDLASAEGVVATIAASNRAGLNAARQLLAGELSRRLDPPTSQLTDALSLVEIGIDFSEEDVSFIARDRLLATIAELRATLQDLITHSARFERLDHEPRIVLAGRPNAGKSSLLNALAGRDRAIVTDVAGTTRDALSDRVALSGGFVTLVDVAGLDNDDTATSQTRFAANEVSEALAINPQMQSTAEDEIARADAIVLVIASDDERPALRLSRDPDFVVRSKADLLHSPPLAGGPGERAAATTSAARVDDASWPLPHGESRKSAIAVTIKGVDGLATLRTALNVYCFAGTTTETTGNLALNVRHRKAIGDAIVALARAAAAIDHGAEIIAAELRIALDDLGRVLGKVAPDDVLGRIFSGFCIGK